MNISTSEYSSGCESGWTMYLDQLSNSTGNCVTNKKGAYVDDDDDDDDEDLSMVSDASSGPPHFYHDYDENSCGVERHYFAEEKKRSKLKNKTKETTTKTRAKKEQKLCLDDTASSPNFDFSQDNVPPSDFSQVFSSAHFEAESISKKHLGYLKSSTKGKSGSLLGRKRQ